MKNKTIIELLIIFMFCVASAAVSFFAISFILWEFNPSKWEPYQRLVAGFMAGYLFGKLCKLEFEK